MCNNIKNQLDEILKLSIEYEKTIKNGRRVYFFKLIIF